MTTHTSRQFRLNQIRTGLAILTAIFSYSMLPGYSDTVVLKDGSKIEGKITLEASDFIKIQLDRSGSIKETKMLKRSDIASITKTKPDELALQKIKKSLPTRSLMTSSSYKSLIQVGSEAFLKAYPDSLHKTEVKKILKELNAEKAKVDRGSIKLEGKWISAKERQAFRTLIDSRIRIYTMREKAKRRNFIGTLRDFQIIEEQFIGTPAYPEAVKIARTILPQYGKALSRQFKDADYLNKKREADIKLLPPEKQAVTQAAYKKEQERFKALAEREKKTGIKWHSVNSRNRDSLSPMIDVIRKEIKYVEKIDIAKLAVQADNLIQIDKLISENKLKEAWEQLNEVAGNTSSGNRGSSRKGGKKRGNYSDNLAKKISFKQEEVKIAAQNASASDKAKAVAAAIKQTAGKLADKVNAKDDKSDEQSAEDAMDAALEARSKAAKANKPADKNNSASNRPKSTKKKKGKSTPPPVVEEEGGGINLRMIGLIFVGIMGIVIVVIKKMGIGGGAGKDDEGEDGGADE